MHACAYKIIPAGDAADELLGGYSFTHALNAAAWAHNRRRMSHLMTFGSHKIGKDCFK